MKVRGYILLAVLGLLFAEQLPLDPALWDGGAHSCCAFAQACPMSARPSAARTAGPMSDCDMDGMGKQTRPKCTMRALCGAPGRSPEMGFWSTALVQPALLDHPEWKQVIAQEGGVLERFGSWAPTPGKAPPTPPPRRLAA